LADCRVISPACLLQPGQNCLDRYNRTRSAA
jgi:hypothetical protein